MPRRKGPITDEELESLNLKFQCAGCGRAEVSMVTTLGHERHCPYVNQVRHWPNPDTENDDDEDAGSWEVERVLQLRGPPHARYVQLLWMVDPELDLEMEDHEFADVINADGTVSSGDGSWAFGWHDGVPARPRWTPGPGRRT